MSTALTTPEKAALCDALLPRVRAGVETLKRQATREKAHRSRLH